MQNIIVNKKKEYKNENRKEDNIVFSKTVLAGKRVYYLDVRKTRKGDLFLTMTESKKVIEELGTNAFHFEKQKLFLYQEDFGKFMEGMNETIAYIKKKELDRYLSKQT